MHIVRTGLALMSAAALLGVGAGALAAGPDGQATVYGVWRNPKGSVHVDIRPCGEATACGYVVWANAKAQADARKGGTRELVGLQLFRNMTQVKGGAWKGKVFVPDLNSTFSGTAEPVDAMTLRAKGCLLAGILCKSQVWTRVGGPGG